MRILFLDDDPKRISRFRELCPHVPEVEQTADGMKSRILWQDAPTDILFLDHDLDGKTFVNPLQRNCGMEVVRMLWDLRDPLNQRIKLIVCHSFNEPRGIEMVVRLRRAGFTAIYEMFDTGMFRSLAGTPDRKTLDEQVALLSEFVHGPSQEQKLKALEAYASELEHRLARPVSGTAY